MHPTESSSTDEHPTENLATDMNSTENLAAEVHSMRIMNNYLGAARQGIKLYSYSFKFFS